MTDRETLKAMFDRAGVVYQEEGSVLEVEAKDGPVNLGYTGFASTFTFTEDGALGSVGAWE